MRSLPEMEERDRQVIADLLAHLAADRADRYPSDDWITLGEFYRTFEANGGGVV